jgi:flagellar motor protein MotB
MKLPPSQYDSALCISDLMAGVGFIFIAALMSYALIFQKQRKVYESTQNELLTGPLMQRHLLQVIHQDLQSNGLRVNLVEDEGVIRLQEEALSFPMAKAYPEDLYRQNLAKIAKIISHHLHCSDKRKPIHPMEAGESSDCQVAVKTQTAACLGQNLGLNAIMIEGHTDAAPLKPGVGYFDNWTLSAARASTVYRIMRRCAPELDQLTNQDNKHLFGVAGYAAHRPAYTEDLRDVRNRRIDLRFVMDAFDLATLKTKNGKKLSTKL